MYKQLERMCYVLLLLILIAVIFTMTKDTEPDQLDNYSELVDLFNDGKVQSFRTEGNKIILTLRSDSTDKTTVEKTYDLYSFGVFYSKNSTRKASWKSTITTRALSFRGGRASFRT